MKRNPWSWENISLVILLGSNVWIMIRNKYNVDKMTVGPFPCDMTKRSANVEFFISFNKYSKSSWERILLLSFIAPLQNFMTIILINFQTNRSDISIWAFQHLHSSYSRTKHLNSWLKIIFYNEVDSTYSNEYWKTDIFEYQIFVRVSYANRQFMPWPLKYPFLKQIPNLF